MKPATVISKTRGDEPEIHYLIGPQRLTREEAEQDLKIWNDAASLAEQIRELQEDNRRLT
jgi:hypothetical protein